MTSRKSESDKRRLVGVMAAYLSFKQIGRSSILRRGTNFTAPYRTEFLPLVTVME
jgi:hypothetical protein